MQKAYETALKSPDPSTQNSALLVDATKTSRIKDMTGQWPTNKIVCSDVNRFPEGVKDLPERWERPLKYKIIEHAERNVIFQAACMGISTYGLTMVSPWAACSDCARAIIEAGIVELVTDKRAHDKSPQFWMDEIEIAFMMLREADVKITWFEEEIGGIEILQSGEIWRP